MPKPSGRISLSHIIEPKHRLETNDINILTKPN